MATRSRFFVDGHFALGDGVAFGRSDAHKIVHVLRLKGGDFVEVCDSGGRAFIASIVLDGDRASARLETQVEQRAEAAVAITLAQGLPKGQKMDYIIEKATELGVAAILPVLSERTIGRDLARDGKLDRWRRLARAAAQQSGRGTVPTVEEPLRFAELVRRFSAFDRVLVPWEIAPREPLRDVLPAQLGGIGSLLIVIGPEGGIAHAEAQEARAAGARLISLGHRVLRTETAGLVACSAVLYALGEL